MLIGSEIFEGIQSGIGEHERVLVVGEKKLTKLYLKALVICGAAAEHQSLEGAAHGLYWIAAIKGLVS
jgi:2-keto-3-deoxy-galactonokinase